MFKMGCWKNIGNNMKNTQSKITPIKHRKKPGTTYCVGCKDYTDNFKP